MVHVVVHVVVPSGSQDNHDNQDNQVGLVHLLVDIRFIFEICADGHFENMRKIITLSENITLKLN